MNLTHDELRTLIAPYVLGALTADELRVVRAHILSCDECMIEADGYARDASSLLLTVDPAPVPEGFEDRVFARVTDERAVPSTAPRRKRRWSLAAVMSVVLLIATVALGVALLDTRNDLAESERVLAAVVGTEGLELTGTNGAVAKMVPTDDGSVFVASGLPEPPEGRTYQLWLMRGDEVTSGGTFDSSDGFARVEVPRSVEQFERAAVTVEPAGGSEEPTSEPVMASDNA